MLAAPVDRPTRHVTLVVRFLPSFLPCGRDGLQWYSAVISEVVQDEETREDEYLVTFDGYGNQEVVSLGDMMLPPQPKKEEGGGGGGGGASSRRSRSRSRCVSCRTGGVWIAGSVTT